MTLLGKSAQEIADEIGCKIEYVYELRYKKRFGVVR
jgi:DNA-binding CsgD family transcriptional regulator